ncbi:MAG: UbiX family flavin prenyltransferase [Bryobacteraceae bacterium]|nr:UbiX family flavin prenyltransferase [Bryobacteraceae bacterium]
MPVPEAVLRVIVGITGASGAVYGLRLLERLRRREGVQIHLILTRAGEKTLFLETGRRSAEVKALADVCHPIENIGSSLASGSYPIDAMVVAPCSIHTMSAIATGITDNLLTRAADVTLKERRKLILAVRETPLHAGHLRNMLALAEMGAVILPPVPAFYHNPQSILDLVDHTVDRILDLLGLPDPQARRWGEPA